MTEYCDECGNPVDLTDAVREAVRQELGSRQPVIPAFADDAAEHTVADVDEALTELIEQRRADGDTGDEYWRGYQRGLLLARCLVRNPDHLDGE